MRPPGSDRVTAAQGQVRRFFLLGVSNTAVTTVLLAVLARWIDPRVAYTLVFALGLFYATALSGRFVFRTHLTTRRAIAFAAWYLAVYGTGLIVVQLLLYAGLESPELLALTTVAVTAPLNFLGGRVVFRDPRRNIAAPDKEFPL